VKYISRIIRNIDDNTNDVRQTNSTMVL